MVRLKANQWMRMAWILRLINVPKVIRLPLGFCTCSTDKVTTRRFLLPKAIPFHERTQIAEGWGVDVQDIIGIHPVRTPPSDIAGDVGSTVAITRWTQDAAYRTFPTDVQCLYDVELHSGQLSETGPKIFRHVEWTRRLMTREGLLHRLWVGDYCRLIAQEACLVWHNHVLWPAQDFQPHSNLGG